MIAGVAEAIGALSTAETLERMAAFGVPAAPVRSVAEALAGEQVAARDMLVEAGGVSMLGNPVKISGHERSEFSAAPALGEHTGEVLREAGVEGWERRPG